MEKGKLNRHDHHHHPERQNPIKVERKPMKIKYISSPIMVNTRNVSEFRAVVQLLTGKSSNSISLDHGTTSTMIKQGRPSQLLPNHNTPTSMMPPSTHHQELDYKVSSTIFDEDDFHVDFSESLSEFLCW
jgi:hypothetical protein